MKLAYFDCMSGIAGDMLLGALVDAGVDLAEISAGVDSLGLPSCKFNVETVTKKGFRATNITVVHEPEHAHRHLHHITDMIDEAKGLTESQKSLAKRIFTKLGEAEAHVHGVDLKKVHFHECGAVDSIADIVGGAIALDLLAVDRIVCSPIPTGAGSIQIAHGKVSVPAPATAELLRGIPLVGSDNTQELTGELTTPTGAAMVATVVDEFGPLPAMTIESIGYGAGDRDLASQANVLRVIVGEACETEAAQASDQVWAMETNLDDVSGELIGHCTAKLAEAGALDVYTTAIAMKKNRPGVKLSVLCSAADINRLERILFRETATLGVRRWPVSRHKLERKKDTVDTQFGPIEGKVAIFSGGDRCFSPEFESCKAAAEQHERPLREIYDAAQKAWQAKL